MGTLVSVIIINWNGEKFLPDCLGSVKTQSYEPLEVLLVDNASVDDSLAKLPGNIELIKNTVNMGFCIAANQGIERSHGEFIILLNQDVILHRDFIKNIIGTFLKNETTGIISGKILRMDGKTIDSTGQFMNRWCKPVERGYCKIDRVQFDEDLEIFSACGAVACYRRKTLEDVKIGEFEYFDEDFFAFYEDLDLGWRAQLKGWKALYNPLAFAYHYRGGTNKKKLRFQILGRPKEIQLKIIFNRHWTIVKNISKIHFLLYFPFLLARCIMDLFFVLFYNREFKLIINELKLIKSAWGKRAFIQAGRAVSDRYIRKFIT